MGVTDELRTTIRAWCGYRSCGNRSILLRCTTKQRVPQPHLRHAGLGNLEYHIGCVGIRVIQTLVGWRNLRRSIVRDVCVHAGVGRVGIDAVETFIHNTIQ